LSVRRYLLSFPTRRSSDLEIGGGVFAVGDEHPVFPAGEGKALGQVKFGLLFGKVVYDQKRLAFQTARIGPQAGMVFQKEFVFSRSEEHTSELQSRENLVCR